MVNKPNNFFSFLKCLLKEKFQDMLIRDLQSRIIQDLQPTEPKSIDVEWAVETKSITQSVYLTLSTLKLQLDPKRMEPTDDFLKDLNLCQNFEYLKVKNNFFKMLAKKYGFLHWQFPSLDKGSFIEIECEIRFTKTVRFEEAWKQMKSMWKKHMWEFLQDFKSTPDRRISFRALKEFYKDTDEDGKEFRFFRRLKGVSGEKPGEITFEQIQKKLRKPEKLIFVKGGNKNWSINSEQFIFNLSPTKSGETIQKRGAQMSTVGGKKELF
jgi:hypothetical protein